MATLSNNPVVSLTNVFNTYKAGEVDVPAVKGITFTIPRRRFSVIIGLSLPETPSVPSGTVRWCVMRDDDTDVKTEWRGTFEGFGRRSKVPPNRSTFC
jgi:hypothetical protein